MTGSKVETIEAARQEYAELLKEDWKKVGRRPVFSEVIFNLHAIAFAQFLSSVNFSGLQ